MITREKYIILDKPSDISLCEVKLCIINFDIYEEENFLKKLIKDNQNTTFWVAANNYSKDYVLKASKLGIKNVVKFPIKQELIKNFFKEDSLSDCTQDTISYTPLSGLRILIVDDNKMNVSLLEDILSDTGVLIESCTNPVEASELVKTKKYNLFLLDILMPELSGFELAQIITQSEINNNSPVIFISAISGNENVMNGYKLGACSYIEKPFSPELVKAQIYNILKKEELRNFETKEKEAFVATLTHDLKSPIDAEINALKYIIKNKQHNSEEIMSELLNSAKYMKHITDKILCHYKQQSAEISLKKEIVNFNSIILECIEEMKYLAAEKHISFRFYAEKDCFGFIDKIEMKRVINNLISNSIEYSYENSFIDITLKELSYGLSFNIKDYGIGIDLNKYSKIFDEYVTLSKEHKKVGFGLGLNICKQIITAHNGEIFIESSPNNGTSITFDIPDKK